jgi:hypothetical protein
MPTFEADARFWDDYRRLDVRQRDQVRVARQKFVADLQRGRGFRRSLRVRGVQGQPGLFEVTWAPNGRAIFQYGLPRPGRGSDLPIIWRRIGSHDIFAEP